MLSFSLMLMPVELILFLAPWPEGVQFSSPENVAAAIFDRENVDGLLRRDVVTKIYSERI